MLRKITLTLTLITLSLLATGCVEVRLETDLHADGSGRAAMEIAICPEVTAKLAAAGDLDVLPPSTMIDLARLDAERLQAMAGPADVAIKDFASETRNGRRTVSFTMEFASLRGYSWVLSNLMDEKGAGLGVFAGDEGRQVFKVTGYDFADIAARVPAAPETDEPDEETLALFTELKTLVYEHVSSLKIVNVVTVPGNVVESDAMAVDGRTCTWDVGFEEIVADKEILQPVIVFEGK